LTGKRPRGTRQRQTVRVDLAAAAAFTAAALSFVSVIINVVLTYRLTSRGHREQWRREQERPIVARTLTLSDDALSAWQEASLAKQRMSEHMSEGDAWPDTETKRRWEKGWQLIEDLRYEVAQLDLLASGPVRKAASELVRAHMGEWVRAVETGPGLDYDEGRQASQVKIRELRSVLVERARADLGLGPGIQVPPRSLLAKLLGRYQEQPRPDD
jgi:hypothetical protein